MDAAERWLQKNDPRYAQERAKKLRKQREKAEYYREKGNFPPRNKHKKFPLK